MNVEIATPQWFYDYLDKDRYGGWNFTLDPCSSHENHKCEKYFTKEDDGLIQDWGGEGVFMNPPYDNIKAWVQKAYDESFKRETFVICLLPSYTGSSWFQDIVLPYAEEIIFLGGRISFEGQTGPARFDSVIVIFDYLPGRQRISTLKLKDIKPK